jgi:UDP:flavonoid glycosyltransferase YjiC (YdhE family)
MAKGPARTVLFAWELGANLGHIKPMVAIARELIRGGIKAVFAVRDLEHAHALNDDGAFSVLQAPIWPKHKHWGHDGALASYADILAGVGFADAAKLGAVIGAWDALVDLAEPDAVVTDHSPALAAALYARGIPTVAIGTPFTMPPLSLDRLPPLRADQAPAIPEARLMQAVRKALGPRRAPPPAAGLVDLFRTDERVVFGMPELDPYRAFRAEPVVAPPEPLPGFVEAPLRPRLFVYLGTEAPHLEAISQALAHLDFETVAYLRGEHGPVPQFLKRRGHLVYDKPPPVHEILPQVSHVISQGGAFMSQAAVAAGRPHLIMPLHAETELNLRMLEQLGVARRFEPKPDATSIAATISEFVLDPALKSQAREAALMATMRPLENGLSQAVAAITRCLDRGQKPSSVRLAAAAAAAPS